MTTDELIEKTIGELSEAVFATRSSTWLGEPAREVLCTAFAEVRRAAIEEVARNVERFFAGEVYADQIREMMGPATEEHGGKHETE